jgi:hypothetical protein
MGQSEFSIGLLPAHVRGPDGQRLGEIHIDSFVERFAVHPVAGTEEDVATRWRDELRSLISEASAIGLATAPHAAWVLYRLDNDVRVHQTLMLPDVGPQLACAGKVINIPAYTAYSAEGERISEWSTTVEAIRAFVERTSRIR